MTTKFFALLSATSALAFALPAHASTPGQWDAGEQPIEYYIMGSSNLYVPDLHVGVPAFFALQPADIPSTIDDQIAATGEISGYDEGKLRFTLGGSHLLPDDPLRAFCDRGASHLHEFVGSRHAGACSTFEQLRTQAVADHADNILATTNPGDDITASSYWHPCLVEPDALGDGVDRCKKALDIPAYYATGSGDLAVTATMVDFPLGLGYVNGQNMDDPFNLEMKAAVAAANAANVSAGGGDFQYIFTGNGFVGWSCTEPDGTPRDGPEPTIDDLTCSAGDTLIAEIDGSNCADGKNLYSPSGYRHVIPAIQINDSLGSHLSCPTDWVKIPTLVFKPQWVLNNSISSMVDNDSPRLASDPMFQANARAQAGLPGAPVDAASFVCKPGCSFHNDYIVAWFKKYLRRGFRKCLGIPWTDTSETGLDADQTPEIAACLFDTLSPAGATIGQLSHVTLPTREQVDGDEISDYYPTPVPLGHMGPHTMPNQ